MIICNSCGAQLPDDSKFCTSCGSPIDAQPQAAAAPEQPQVDIPAYQPPQQTYQPYQQPYQPYQPPQQQEPVKSSNKALILGIVGIATSFLLAIVGHITSICGIVAGLKEYKATGKNIGLIVSIVGEVLSVISSLIGIAAMM